MEIYLLPILGGNASAGPIETPLPYGSAAGRHAQVGDLVLGIVAVNDFPGELIGLEMSSYFSSVVTQSTENPGPCLIQSMGSLGSAKMIALMQRGNLQTSD